MQTHLEFLRAQDVDPAAADANEPRLLNSIASEINTGLTYITVARIAFDMGQIERCVNAYRMAAEAQAEACRMARLLREPARATAFKQLENYGLVLEDSRDGSFQFAPSLRQPSLN